MQGYIIPEFVDGKEAHPPTKAVERDINKYFTVFGYDN